MQSTPLPASYFWVALVQSNLCPPPASFPPSLQCLEFLPISWPSLKSQTVSFLEYSPPPPAPLCPDHIYSIPTQPGQSVVGLCPNSLHHGYSCDNITYVFRSHNKPYLKQCRDQRQLCPATMVSQMPSRERGSWVSHGWNSTPISMIHFRCLAAACTTSPALSSSRPTFYSTSPRLSTELLVCSQWPNSTTVASTGWTWRVVLPGQGRARCQLRTEIPLLIHP